MNPNLKKECHASRQQPTPTLGKLARLHGCSMQANLKQSLVTVELNEKEASSAHSASGLVSVVLGGILTVGAFSTASSHVESHSPAITVESLTSAGEPTPTLLQFPTCDYKVATATPLKRLKRGKNMSRRRGQIGSISLNGKWWTVRFWMDKTGQEDRVYMRERICPTSGPGLLTASARERKAKEIIAASGADKEETLKEAQASVLGTAFGHQSET